MKGGRRWAALALGLALALGAATTDAAAAKPAPAPEDLLQMVFDRRYGAPVDVLVDRDTAEQSDFDVIRMIRRPSPGIHMQVVDGRSWPKTYTPVREVPLGITFPWPLNGAKRCHAVLEINGSPLASAVNGDPEHPAPPSTGLLAFAVAQMQQIGFSRSTHTVEFSDDDSSNPAFQLVGRKSQERELRSIAPCLDTTVIHRSDIIAVDWKAHFRAYPETGAWSGVPDCIRKELDRLGAPASGRLPDGAYAARTISPISWRGDRIIESCRRWVMRQTDMACNLRYVDTRCQEVWRRSETDSRPLDLVAMTDYLTSSREARIYRGLDESDAARAERERFEAQRALRQKQEAERLAAEAEARRRWEASPEGRAALAAKAERERQAEAQKAREFPYYVLIRCGDLSHITVTLCLSDSVETTLRLRNGGNETLYNLSRILGLRPGWETRDGYRIDLRPSFGLSIQNASSQIMGVKILERRSGRVVFSREVGRYGVITTAR